MIFLLNTSANSLAEGRTQSKLYSVFGICCRTERMIGSQIEDHFHGCPPENTKLMNDMVFDEVNHTNDFNFCDQHGAYFEK